MNPKKIAFIACVNDKEAFAEAEYYINRLVIPEGYEKDIITVEEACSMTGGYNAAMTSSDAKYKVYLHQDVFIINPNFIIDMLEIFRRDSEIGMIGCVGCDDLPLNARAVAAWNVGKVYHNAIPSKMIRRQNEDGTPIPVEAIDGLLMATQYDVAWREDLFDGWDFYDVSQCQEMRRAGYKVAVPYQQEPWCFHDCTYSKMARYQEYCGRFIKEYQDIKPFEEIEYRQSMREYNLLKDESRREIEDVVKRNAKEDLRSVFANGENRGYQHLKEFEALADIDKEEEAAGIEAFWKREDSYEDVMRKLRMLKYALKRIEYNADEGDASLKYMMEHYSMQAINVMFQMYIVEQQGVYDKIMSQVYGGFQAE